MGLHFELDGFRLIYLAVALLMWSVSGVFSLEYMAHYKKKGQYYLFFQATFFATAGVFLSADFYTTFIFFEIMSFTSYVWVAFDEKKESLRAAQTYLAVAVIGGMVMLMGMFLLYDLCGTLRFDELKTAAGEILSGSKRVRLYAAGGLLLFGFGAKAGCFPLHIWLPKAHPVAPAPASALLSGILTKTGIFGIIVVSFGLFGADRGWGFFIACLGLITMFLGALLALFSVNLKRTLACSSVSQIGFILTGIGMGCLLQAAGEDNSLAVRGAFLHMLNHSLFKLPPLIKNTHSAPCQNTGLPEMPGMAVPAILSPCMACAYSTMLSWSRVLLIYPLHKGIPLIPNAPIKKQNIRAGFFLPNPRILFNSSS